MQGAVDVGNFFLRVVQALVSATWDVYSKTLTEPQRGSDVSSPKMHRGDVFFSFSLLFSVLFFLLLVCSFSHFFFSIFSILFVFFVFHGSFLSFASSCCQFFRVFFSF